MSLPHPANSQLTNTLAWAPFGFSHVEIRVTNAFPFDSFDVHKTEINGTIKRHTNTQLVRLFASL